MFQPVVSVKVIISVAGLETFTVAVSHCVEKFNCFDNSTYFEGTLKK